MHKLTSRSLLPHKTNDKGDFLAFHLKEIDYTVNHSAKTKTIIVGICMCSLRTADVSGAPNEDIVQNPLHSIVEGILVFQR